MTEVKINVYMRFGNKTTLNNGCNIEYHITGKTLDQYDLIKLLEHSKEQITQMAEEYRKTTEQNNG